MGCVKGATDYTVLATAQWILALATNQQPQTPPQPDIKSNMTEMLVYSSFGVPKPCFPYFDSGKESDLDFLFNNHHLSEQYNYQILQYLNVWNTQMLINLPELTVCLLQTAILYEKDEHFPISCSDFSKLTLQKDSSRYKHCWKCGGLILKMCALWKGLVHPVIRWI